MQAETNSTHLPTMKTADRLSYKGTAIHPALIEPHQLHELRQATEGLVAVTGILHALSLDDMDSIAESEPVLDARARSGLNAAACVLAAVLNDKLWMLGDDAPKASAVSDLLRAVNRTAA